MDKRWKTFCIVTSCGIRWFLWEHDKYCEIGVNQHKRVLDSMGIEYCWVYHDVSLLAVCKSKERKRLQLLSTKRNIREPIELTGFKL